MADFRSEWESECILMYLEELAESTGGKIIFDFTAMHGFLSVVTDSRNVRPNSLFVPLRGESRDGHLYIEEALKNGACCFFCDYKFLEEKKNKNHVKALCEKYYACCIAVTDNLKALQAAAKRYLAQFSGLYKVGITGSCGKTTTKEILVSIFSQKYKTVYSEGNLNSETGLPLSVFSVRPEHEVGIFELGMNRKGEIAEITDVLLPNAAIITNIGTAHIGILGSKQAIAEEKKQIFSKFTDGDIGFVSECEYTDFLKNVPHGNIFVYSKENLPSIKEVEDKGFNGTKITYKGESILFPLPGRHNMQNVFACIALAEKKGFTSSEIKIGLETVHPLFGRSQIVRGFITCFMDCYNANPESVNEAVEFCNSVKTDGLKHYVLGSMLELGKESAESHKEICRKALTSSADFVYLFGDEFAQAFDDLPEGKSEKPVFVCRTEEFDRLESELKENLSGGDFVLLKGSRGLALERLEQVLKKEGWKNE